ncbi:MAG: LacI family DNA-binding transcriptional regulator [Rhodobacteraceae bacterium]|nr:LacI family DNA-binding transcriptional regulator [Paracoccaceae bacterium]
MATLAEIAHRAGVSSALVSRVINNDGTLRVSRKTRENILKVAHELNYAPNVVAKSLRSSKSDTIAFVVHDAANPVYGEILRGAQAEAERRNKAILLGDSAAGNVGNSRLAQMIGGCGVDGLILQAAGIQADNLIIKAAHQKVPVVQLQTDIGLGGSLIQLPDIPAAEMATRHLRELGHRTIGCLATSEGLTFTEGRMQGWRNEMGAAADPSLVAHAAPFAAEGASVTRELLLRRPDITGLVCFNVVAAIGAMRAANALGLDVPQDLSIVSIHDMKFAGDLKVPLTVVRMPLAEMGRVATKTVCIEASEIPARITIGTAPEFVQRQSTAVPGRV